MAEVRTRETFVVRSRPAIWALERAASFAPLALRLPLGVVMAAHGVQKITDLSGTAAGFEAMGFSPGIFWGTLVGLMELLGGAALIVGLLTRVAAFALLGVQLVAMLVVHLPNGFFLNWTIAEGQGHGIEFSLVNLGALLALILLGSGAAAVDDALRGRRRRLETHRAAT